MYKDINVIIFKQLKRRVGVEKREISWNLVKYQLVQKVIHNMLKKNNIVISTQNPLKWFSEV